MEKKNDTLINFLENTTLKSMDWVEGLEDRKKEELDFHNFDRDKESEDVIEKQKEIDVHSNKRFYSITEKQKIFINDWLKKNITDKVFLDYACGDGLSSFDAANHSPEMIIGIDISDISVLNAKKQAKQLKLKNCYFFQADCENTELPDESVDVILCQGMLHHLDLKIAFPELKRILKKNGKVLCVEALSVNPLIQLYRDSTPEMRTEWEKAHILGPKDLKFAKKFFHVNQVKYWYLFSLLAVPFRNTFLFRPLNTLFSAIDAVFLKIPYLNRLAWQFTFVLNKK